MGNMIHTQLKGLSLCSLHLKLIINWKCRANCAARASSDLNTHTFTKWQTCLRAYYGETYDSPQTWVFWMTLVVSSHFFPEASRIPRTFSISWCKILGSKELDPVENPLKPSSSCGKVRTILSGASWWRWTGTHVLTSSRAASRSVSSS